MKKIYGKVRDKHGNPLSGAPALCIYFRPMSLEKYKAGLADISPDLDVDNITIRVNDEPVLLGSCNEVKEFCQMSETNEAVCLKGYFIMTTLPQSGLKKTGNFLEVKIKDKLLDVPDYFLRKNKFLKTGEYTTCILRSYTLHFLFPRLYLPFRNLVLLWNHSE